jgi:ParB family chromosome partitioning protein
MGKDRATITNTLRLLKLPQSIKDMIDRKEITSGHARAILQVSEEFQEEFALSIIKNAMSVRKAEDAAAKYSKSKPAHTTKKSEIDQELIASLEKNLKNKFGKSVKIKTKSKEKGELVIPFKNKKELDELIKNLNLS